MYIQRKKLLIALSVNVLILKSYLDCELKSLYSFMYKDSTYLTYLLNK